MSPFEVESPRCNLPWLAALGSPLLTDLYQLTMLKAYLEQNMLEDAVFEFFARGLPARRNFLLAAGLEQLLDFLESICFSEDELNWLVSAGYADRKLIEYLREFRFRGDVYAVPEGTTVFAGEPLVRVVASLPEAQLIESRLVNIMNFQTLIASKAVRAVLVAAGKLLVDFGMRRAHGAEAALLAARATYVAGFQGTATVLAGRMFDIPIYGTMAHSFVQAHETEVAAFENFAAAHADNVVLLIDSYDTLAGARKVASLLPKFRSAGVDLRAVRIDSGDLVALSREVRAILDAAGAEGVRIFASGGLNEYEVERIVQAGAPVDGFGIGTDLDVSSDAPALDCAYKLQEYAGRACRKRSTGKETWPGRKQIFRRYSGDGTLAGDVVGLETETGLGTPLLVPVMRGGKRIAEPESLTTIQQRSAISLQAVPVAQRLISPAVAYRVDLSAGVRALAAAVDANPV